MYKVTQEHFNFHVMENAELFEQSVEQSIKDTVEQFKAQGVNMLGIITDINVVTGENPIKAFKENLDASTDDTKKIALIKDFSEVVKKGIDYQVACSSYQIYETCLDLLQKDSSSADLKFAILEFFCLLFHGYPDLVTPDGVTYFVSLLEKDEKHIILGLKLITLTCLKHDGNRELYAINKVVERISSIMTPGTSDAVLRLICKAVCALSCDDDFRTLNNHSYYFAVGFGNILLKPFCYLLKVKKNPQILVKIIKALIVINPNTDSCVATEAAGGLVAVVSILEKARLIEDLPLREDMYTNCFLLLSSLVGNPSVKDKLMRHDIIQILHTAMNQFPDSRKLIHKSLLLISKICLRAPEYGKLFFKADFPELIVPCLKKFITDSEIQISGCWCIRNMASRNPEYHKQYLDNGAEDLLREICGVLPGVGAEARIALNCLGCQVVAEEPWTGEFGDKLARE